MFICLYFLVKISEDGDKIVVEAVPFESERKDYLVKLPDQEDNESKFGSHDFCNACPLCRLNLRRLEYSDILILHQFVETNGRLMPREVTGLCIRSYDKVKKMVRQAHSARLLPRPPEFEVNGPWDDLNRYYQTPRRHRDVPMRIIRKEYWDSSVPQ